MDECVKVEGRGGEGMTQSSGAYLVSYRCRFHVEKWKTVKTKCHDGPSFQH